MASPVTSNQRLDIEVRQAYRNPVDETAVRTLMQETYDYHDKIAAGEPSLTFKPRAQAAYLNECLGVLVYGNEGYEPARSFLAWHGKKPVGYILARILRDYYYSIEYYGYIEQIIVSENYRNLGVGEKLLEACYKWLETRAINTITLKVYGPNDEAIKFYESEGFKPLRYELVLHR